MLVIRNHPITKNDFRQSLRIATGGALGLTLSKLMEINYGIFFSVIPMLLLVMVPVMNAYVAKQVIASSVVSIIEVAFVAAIFSSHPVLMTMIVFVMFLYRFACMSKGSLFIFGANGVVSLSIMLHFASYPDFNVNDLVFYDFWGCVTAVIIAYMMSGLFPDVEPRQRPTCGKKEPHRMRHEALLGATVATLSYCVFQTFDLRDSVSAQSTTLILLFPMFWNGILVSARNRALGTILGVAVGLTIQLLLSSWAHQLLLIIPLFWIIILIFAHVHFTEGGGSGIGFTAIASLGMLYGQYLKPDGDLIFSGLYRMSSILIACIATVMVCYLVHSLLNKFEVTRFGS